MRDARPRRGRNSLVTRRSDWVCSGRSWRGGVCHACRTTIDQAAGTVTWSRDLRKCCSDPLEFQMSSALPCVPGSLLSWKSSAFAAPPNNKPQHLHFHLEARIQSCEEQSHLRTICSTSSQDVDLTELRAHLIAHPWHQAVSQHPKAIAKISAWQQAFCSRPSRI